MEATADLIETGIMSREKYDKDQLRGKFKVVRPGKGPGRPALIDYRSFNPGIRQEIEKKLGANPFDIVKKDPPAQKIETDYAAFEFFTAYRYDDGSPIPTNKQDNILLWANGASILNMLKFELERHTMARAAQGRKPLVTEFFKNAVKTITDPSVSNLFENNLPTNPRRLKDKLDAYLKHGYESLIKHNKNNDNARKINYNLERLICFIATLPTRPYNTEIKEIYEQFMAGEVELVDKKTGELYDREDFLKDGEMVTFSEARAWQIVNDNRNQVQINKKRMGWKDFDEKHRPHRHRISPQFSFSKISLDDRDLIWKDKTTDKRVKAYYAYDVASTCRIGSAYSMVKDETLFLDCLRDMFVFIDRNGLGIPMEVEVENHLVNKFFNELKEMFPLLTICAPANSKEKRAEHFNRAVKYSVEKNNHPGVGRWWLKSVYNRIPVDKVDDQFKQTMKSADRMIADDIQDTMQYNNALHPNQRLYPGMTRLEVLFAKVNPNLPKFEKSFIYKYIGYETKDIKIYNTQYCKVQYEKYQLPHPRIIEKLEPNNLTVDAYWLPNENGIIDEVYLYQNGTFICTAKKQEGYNEAKAERTEADDAAKLKQDKYVAQFDKYSKDETWANVQVIKNEPEITESTKPVEVFEAKINNDIDYDDFENDIDPLNNF